MCLHREHMRTFANAKYSTTLYRILEMLRNSCSRISLRILTDLISILTDLRSCKFRFFKRITLTMSGYVAYRSAVKSSQSISRWTFCITADSSGGIDGFFSVKSLPTNCDGQCASSNRNSNEFVVSTKTRTSYSP